MKGKDREKGESWDLHGHTKDERPTVKPPAHRAGPFDKSHGSELVEELPGHAVANRM